MLKYVLLPFEKHFGLLFLLFVLISAIDVYDLLEGSLYSYAIYILFHGYLTAYLICLIYSLIPFRVGRVFLGVVYFMVLLWFYIDLFCQMAYETRFNHDFAAIILQTNFSEMQEFIGFNVSPHFVILGLSSLIAFIYLFIYIKKRPLSLGLYFQYVALVGVIVAAFLFVRNPMVGNDVLIGKVVSLFNVPSVPDLKEYLHNPDINSQGNKPKNLVVIIGESFSKSHSSLYGYEKETNPKLNELSDKGLYVYNNIVSPSTNTIPCFQAMMSTYRHEYEDSIQWYECLSLPEVVKVAGYNTCWVSNQSKVGFFDSVAGAYADLCDESYFVGDKFAGLDRKSYDGEIITLLKPLLKNNDQMYNCYFIHLMGSHSSFKSRYPQSFSKFTENDYMHYKEHQRDNLAAYDNSILYNDSVVYEIMSLFKDKEAVVLYFSDHAIDVYESSDDYISHAKIDNPVSVEAGKRIPFMIYTSSLYRQNFDGMIERIERVVDKPYCTEDLIYTIMDIMAIELENVKMQGNSLLND